MQVCWKWRCLQQCYAIASRPQWFLATAVDIWASSCCQKAVYSVSKSLSEKGTIRQTLVRVSNYEKYCVCIYNHWVPFKLVNLLRRVSTSVISLQGTIWDSTCCYCADNAIRKKIFSIRAKLLEINHHLRLRPLGTAKPCSLATVERIDLLLK